MGLTDDELRTRAAAVRLVLLDVDGVLTDGRLYMAAGGFDARTFHTRDGIGVRLGQRAGLEFGIVSGRRAEVVETRAAELDLTEVHQGVRDKRARVATILERAGLDRREACFVGDDVVDLPAMRLVGLSVAPADAAPEVRDAADLVTTAAGGAGVVREVVELLLRSRDRWTAALEPYVG